MKLKHISLTRPLATVAVRHRASGMFNVFMNIFQFKVMTLALAAGFVAGPTDAATIAWNVHSITGSASDISTTGTLVEATSGNAGGQAIAGGAPVTVNGVDFAQGRILDNTTRDRPATIPTLADSAYTTLLAAASSTTSNGDQAITFTGLTVGDKYEIQIWASHTGFAGSGLVLNNGSGVVNPGTSGHATLLYEAGTGNPGQYAFGTFTADGTSQTFNLRRWQNLSSTPSAASEPYVNAIQLRQIPEPSAALLGGLGMLALLRRRRD